jgi:tetratricopeptide (TPR) repeat protein
MGNGVPQSVEEGTRILREARLKDAERAHAAALRRDPNNFDALHRLGFVRYEQERYPDALKLLQKALRLRPKAADALLHYGMVLRRLDRHQEALAFYDKALVVKSDYPEGWNNRGNVLLHLNRHEEALASLEKAIALRPRYAEAHFNRGNVLLGLRRFDEAITSFDQALKLNELYIKAFNNRGNALQELERFEDALASYDRALAIDPEFLDALNNRCKVLLDLKRYEEALATSDMLLALKPMRGFSLRADALLQLKRFNEALAVYDESLRLDPNSLDALNKRGLALLELKRYQDSLASYDKALVLDPNRLDLVHNRAAALAELNRFEEALASYDRVLEFDKEGVDALLNRGNVLADLERFDEAFASHEKVLAIKPDHQGALFNRGMLYLRLGQWREGWEGYEHRWDENSAKTRPALHVPEWGSESLDGRSILVHSEQGFGDSIQFIRYLEPLSRVTNHVTFFAPKQLVRLFQPFADRVRLISDLDSNDQYDFRCALLSLPHRFQTDVTNVPNSVPYLSAEPDRVLHWRERIGTEGFKIGICWQGNPAGKIDKGRSVPLEKFLPLARVPGVRLISLQKNYGLDQLGRLPPGMCVETLGEDFDPGPDAFIDTAAVMANLDLVVSMDTSVAHVAGGLGRPAWLILQYLPDWRWLQRRDDTPWYPTMKLFRQPKRDNWEAPVAAMAAELEGLLDARADGRAQ